MKHNPRRAWVVFAWTLAAFAGLQLALTLTLECRRPNRSDPEFELRSSLLASAQRAEPKRPLLLVVGSSRFVTAFHPECMAPLKVASNEKAPLVFNFSHFGAGPIVNLLEIRRLLAEGVRPRWMVLELLPAYLAFDGSSLATAITATRDLGCLHRYRRNLGAAKLYGRWLLARLVPCCKHRAQVCSLVLPDLFPEPPPAVRFDPLGGFYEDDPDAEPDPSLAAARLADSRARYFEVLRDFCIDPDADAAVRESIVAAQQAGVQVVLMINPESTEYRSWYAQGADARLNDYSHELSATYGIPVVDARGWLPDREFMDGHHLIGAAAKRFTEQFARQVLQPVVEGRIQGVFRLAPLP